MADDLPSKSHHGLFTHGSAFWEKRNSFSDPPRFTRSTLTKISKWCSKWGFIITKTKSVAMLFTRKRKTYRLLLNLDRIYISLIENFKYFLIVFDRNLSDKYYIGYLKSKCAEQINLMRILRDILGCWKKKLCWLHMEFLSDHWRAVECAHTSSNRNAT